MDPANIDNLKYNELRKMAKELGIRANMKADKLRHALKEHFIKTNEAKSSRMQQQQEAAAPPVSRKRKHDSSGVLTPKLQPVTNVRGSANKSKATPVQKVQTPSQVLSAKATPQMQKRPASSKKTPAGTSGGVKLKKPVSVTRTGSHQKRSATKKERVLNSATRRSPRAALTPDIVKKPQQKSPEKRRQSRRSTFELKEGPSSPAVKGMLDAMKPETMTDDQMKDSLMKELDKRAKQQQQQETKEKQGGATAAGGTQIPRFVAYLAKKREQAKDIQKGKSPGKDWAKIHQKQFDQMDSLDTYMEKKRKRTASTNMDVKRIKMLAEKRHGQKRAALIDSMKKKTPGTGARVGKPMLKKTVASPGPNKTPFIPTITSTKNMNLNFGALKSPKFTASVKRVPSALNQTVTFGDKENVSSDLKTPSLQKSRKSVATPYKVTGKTVSPKSTMKTFDLKQSLSRPITWKMHRGKLPEFTAQSALHAKADPKQVRVNARDARRKALHERRAGRKDQDKMRRRAIMS